PENKFNIGVTGHDLRIPFTTRPDLGFGINYKYIEGFTFEGSPQFTGPIPSYDMVDAQVNVRFPKENLTVKLGCSDLFGVVPLFDPDVPDGEKGDRMWNNDVRMVYGGPLVGRLAYLQLIYELDMR
ncbi:MAG: TonB-dependent receptor, partial [Flavobacteriales bacterium]|nr:TonB-dependent receptor [Flavobacteriales bacterium]